MEGVDMRVAVAFWLFGLINNLFYVVLLSAALDLVGPLIPKATVLLSSIIPGLLTKLIVPHLLYLIPYSVRTIVLATLSTSGMLVVALSSSTNISAKLAGIVLANISSGAGEVNFLALTHFYSDESLAGWSSGTGGAGLLGAGVYALATTGLGFSVRSTLLASAVVPLGMVAAYFLLLPLGPLTVAKGTGPAYESVPRDGYEDEDTMNDSRTGLLGDDDHHGSSAFATKPRPNLLATLRTNFRRTLPLLRPYMLPLFLVYTAEYTLNQGVLPTVLFQLEGTPFNEYRAFYPTYSFIYQAGVFVSRSSLPFLRIRQLYTPAMLQVANLALLTIQALTPFIPSVWIVFGIVFWEGLLGGLVYVSTYAAVREEVPEEEREFSLGAVTVSDSAGIFVAGLLGVVMETQLCSWQVGHGIDKCRRL
ncbi:battenin CLN3 protein [Elasticomyces elasticus]|nr:battenin CLN3 protein [Elasticomyces elasticus]KAK3663321.1 battenin CLN3 protein [Elasticomyces elasticus]KAK4904126.1 battenin CLN3 protein [Elasticomyces elasticus]KAK5733792.1 battenin CLN3 protein [Elasticomyces elasticus]